TSKSVANGPAVRKDRIHAAVGAGLKKTLTAETLEAYLRGRETDESARASRQAQRAALLARIPAIAKEEGRLVDLIAQGLGAEAMAAKVKVLQAERKDAEARLLDLEAQERELHVADTTIDRVKALIPPPLQPLQSPRPA